MLVTLPMLATLELHMRKNSLPCSKRCPKRHTLSLQPCKGRTQQAHTSSQSEFHSRLPYALRRTKTYSFSLIPISHRLTGDPTEGFHNRKPKLTFSQRSFELNSQPTAPRSVQRRVRLRNRHCLRQQQQITHQHRAARHRL